MIAIKEKAASSRRHSPKTLRVGEAFTSSAYFIRNMRGQLFFGKKRFRSRPPLTIDVLKLWCAPGKSGVKMFVGMSIVVRFRFLSLPFPGDKIK